MEFSIIEKNGAATPLAVTVTHLINAGYTGRDQAAVQAHIDELKAEGIPAPDKTPTYSVKFADRITQAESFEVLDETDHSGEAEFALVFHNGEVFVGVGSDHTDRKLEVVSIPKAKQIYPNTISKELWRLDDVVDHWDEIILRSWVKNDGKKMLLQEAKLTAMLDAPDLIERVKKLLHAPTDIEGLVVYSGTVAALIKADYSPYFECELEDPVLHRTIRNVYELKCISDWYLGY